MPKSQYDAPRDPVSDAQDAAQAKLNREQYNTYKAGFSWKNYNVGAWHYPEELNNREDLKHYVAFFINVRDKSTASKIGRTDNPDYLVNPEEQRRLNALAAAEARLPTSGARAAIENIKPQIGTIAGALAFAYNFGTKSGFKDAVLYGALKAAGTKLAVDTSVKMIENAHFDVFSSGVTSRLKEVITLHIEESPSARYGVNYSTAEISALAGILIEGSANATAENFNSFSKEAAARFITALGQAPQLGAARGFISDLRELSTRVKSNPFRETLFESVDYRRFSFRYRFFPKNEIETNRVKDIIDTFKTHMYPELTPNKLFYVYPSEFDIQYFFGEKENTFLHKFTKCALTDMQVTYGGEQFATFKNGAPVEIGLTLTFTELEQLNSAKVKDGY